MTAKQQVPNGAVNKITSNKHRTDNQSSLISSSSSSSLMLNQEHRLAITQLVAAAKLSDDFWSYYKAGRGRLTLPPPVPVTSSKDTKVRPCSASIEQRHSQQTINEIETVNQFLIFLNALRLFSFFPLASQLEAVVLPDRCIRVSPSGNLRRRGELQLCIGIARIRLPVTNRLTGVTTHQWIRCCRFKPSNNKEPTTGEQQSDFFPNQSANNNKNRRPFIVHNKQSPTPTDQMTQPLLVDCGGGVGSNSNVSTSDNKTPPLLTTTANRPAPPSMMLIDDSDARKKEKRSALSLLSCFCCKRRDKTKTAAATSLATVKNKYLVASDGDDDEEDDNEAAMTASRKNLFVNVNKPPVLVKTPPQEEPDVDAAQLQAIHDHFVKTCLHEATAELSEFVEKTIGALFFDVSRGGSGDDDAVNYDDCCGLVATAPNGASPSHIAVSICFTAERQLTKLERCLSDRSLLTSVKSFVFPYNLRPPSSSSAYLSATGSSSSAVASPISPLSASSMSNGGDSSCPPVADPPPQPTPESSPLLLLPSDVELFVVVRQTWIKSVISDLQPSSSSTMLRASQPGAAVPSSSSAA